MFACQCVRPSMGRVRTGLIRWQDLRRSPRMERKTSSQGCVAAQVIFHYRCEPTQVEIAISAGNHKSCLAVTVLRCDFLHDIIDGKCGEEAYTGGIACEQLAREGIDVVIRNGHAHQSIR